MWKRIAVILIILATLGFFGYYLSTHPEILSALTGLRPLTLIVLAIGYCLFTLANAMVLYYCLRLIGHHVSLFENAILSGYSSIINFFGPLQSGPLARALYLKKQHQVKIRDFIAVTFLFYGFYAAINGFIIWLAAAFRYPSWWFFVLTLVIIAAGCGLAWLAYRKIEALRRAVTYLHLGDLNFWMIGVSALFLTAVMAGIFHTELHHIQPSVSIIQTAVYTAAANLAIFVSLTPGAIGFRESFLVLSEHLHHIPTATIIGANVIDRAFYVGFLIVLFVILIGINSREHLAIFSKSKKHSDDDE